MVLLKVYSHNNEFVSEVEFHLVKKKILLTSVFVEEKFRGRDYGKMMILASILYSESKEPKKIYVDDMSDRARKKGNLYRSIGFKYLDKENSPEMKGDIKVVKAKIESQIQHINFDELEMKIQF